MAGSLDNKRDQYTLDFESAAAERHAKLMSALTLTGTMKYAPLARLVCNMQERSGGDPLAWTGEAIGEALGVSRRTVFNWTVVLVAAGILSVTYRRSARGGCRSNLLAIDWPSVHALVVNRTESTATDRPATFAKRPANFATRPANFAGPIKELPSLYPSELNTTTTTALPHAQPLPHAAPNSERYEAEVDCVDGEGGKAAEIDELVKHCWTKIVKSALPTRLREALASAVANGCTVDELRERCRWFHKHWMDWPAEHRPGAFYRGLADAVPGVPPDHGWPYQR